MAGNLVVDGALLSCSFGAAPSALGVLVPLVKGSKMPACNIMDNQPMTNVKPFSVCSSMSNPAVASATSDNGKGAS